MAPFTLARTICSFVVSIGLLIAPGFAGAQTSSGAEGDTTTAGTRRVETLLLITGAYWAAGLPIMEHVWYRDQARVPFHFFNDNSAYLQVDKFGHAFGAYVQSYVAYHWLRRTGLSETNSLIFGGALGLILQTPIEVMDGIHEGWGFSWGDMAANAAGSGLVAGQALLFGDQLVKYKFSYWESRYADSANGYLGETTLERILEDYNGHTYWLSVPIARVTGLKPVPSWLNIAVGYGANGMIGDFENIREFRGVPIPEASRDRQYLLSLDVDWTKLATNSPALRTILTALTFAKLPFPALEVDSQGRLRGYWWYY